MLGALFVHRVGKRPLQHPDVILAVDRQTAICPIIQ